MKEKEEAEREKTGPFQNELSGKSIEAHRLAPEEKKVRGEDGRMFMPRTQTPPLREAM